MIITFYSNYFNHHQKALCDELSALSDTEFYFVETEPMEEFRSGMGWGVKDMPSYVISAYESDDKREAAMELSRISDVAIVGSAPEEYVEERILSGKLTFRYTERPMKEGWIKMFIPRLTKKFYRLHYRNRNRDLYLLGASAYAAADYKLLHSYPGKCLKFGYFPVGEPLTEEELFAKKNRGDVPNILWTGRFLKLKRADLLLTALGEIHKKGIPFHLTMVGNGEEEENLRKIAEDLKLTEVVTFMDFVKPHEVRQMMEEADLYIMTSNFLEGWGSVIYEGLSAGCAVIASHACGCSPWLVKPEETGLLYKSGDAKSLQDKLERFLTDPSLRDLCGRGAYRQMQTLWNPKVAAKRIREFSEGILDKRPVSYEDGPLSPAPVLKNNWYRD